MTKILNPHFFVSDHVVNLSQRLLGKFVFTRSKEGSVTGGMIIEVEAYAGPDDRAAHSYNNRRTARTEIMFQEGGVCYVYLCYGVHFLLNFVCGAKNLPHGILIRGILPKKGLEEISKRTGKTTSDNKPVLGPGNVSKALGIDQTYYGEKLNGSRIWVEDRGFIFSKEEILAKPRVGVDYAGEDAKLPWRFIVA